MLFVLKPYIQALCYCIMCVSFLFLIVPLECFSPWDHFNALIHGIARFKWKVFMGKWSIVAII
jgi:hypothetical protein